MMRSFLLLFALLRVAAASELHGVIRHWTGAAIPDAVVKLCPLGARASVSSARTDNTGAYAFSGVPPGTYDLEISHAGFRLTRVRGVKMTEEGPKAAPPV